MGEEIVEAAKGRRDERICADEDPGINDSTR
jgi:hypothetical protein